MLYRAFLLLSTSFFLAMDGTMAQTPPQFIVPNANFRAKLDASDPVNIKLAHTIVHGNLGAVYEIKINYYAPGCQGPTVTPNPVLDTDVTTTAENGLFNSVIVNPLSDIRDNDGSPASAPVFYTLFPNPNPTQSFYKYCIEFVLKSVGNGGAIHDQVRYDVTLTGNKDGAVSTDATVITDIDSGASTTFTARVYVCVTDPANTPAASSSYVAYNSNFFQGDTISFCFESNNYPEASISALSAFSLTFGSPTTTVDVKPSTSVTTSVYQVDCTAGTTGLRRCKLNVGLTGTVGNTLFPVSDPPNSEKTITAVGNLAMKFGSGRRNVRVLFQSDETFSRNANTTFVVSTDEKAESCNCGGFILFQIICWIWKCFLGF